MANTYAGLGSKCIFNFSVCSEDCANVGATHKKVIAHRNRATRTNDLVRILRFLLPEVCCEVGPMNHLLVVCERSREKRAVPH